jgi:hypothetical protein
MLPQIGTKFGKSAYISSLDNVSETSSGDHNTSAVIKQSPTRASEAIKDKAECKSSRDLITGNMVESPSIAKLIVTIAIVGAAVDVESTTLDVTFISPELTGEFHLFTWESKKKVDPKQNMESVHVFPISAVAEKREARKRTS